MILGFLGGSSGGGVSGTVISGMGGGEVTEPLALYGLLGGGKNSIT